MSLDQADLPLCTVDRSAPWWGFSPAAQDLARGYEAACRSLLQSDVFSSPIAKVEGQLKALEQQCAAPNWDGYGAAAVDAATLIYAYKFLRSLPWSAATPEIAAEPDGQVTFEWYRSPRYTLSISVSPEGELHYAALRGSSKRYGTELFLGDTAPAPIFDLIWRMGASC